MVDRRLKLAVFFNQSFASLSVSEGVAIPALPRKFPSTKSKILNKNE
jgi:hypothetical protein